MLEFHLRSRRMMVPVLVLASFIMRTGPLLGMGPGPFGLLMVALPGVFDVCARALAQPHTSSAAAASPFWNDFMRYLPERHRFSLLDGPGSTSRRGNSSHRRSAIVRPALPIYKSG